MMVRAATPEDLGTIARFHEAMGMGYEFPDWGPLYAIQRVAVSADGRAIAAAAVKLTGEAFLWLDPAASNVVKAAALVELGTQCSQASSALGLEDVSCWVPPEIEPSFGPVLERLGWLRSPWQSWTKPLK